MDNEPSTFEGFLYLLLAIITAEQVIITGEFHIWRGMLNPIGSEAYHLFHLLVDELEKSGYIHRSPAKPSRSRSKARRFTCITFDCETPSTSAASYVVTPR